MKISSLINMQYCMFTLTPSSRLALPRNVVNRHPDALPHYQCDRWSSINLHSPEYLLGFERQQLHTDSQTQNTLTLAIEFVTVSLNG